MDTVLYSLLKKKIDGMASGISSAYVDGTNLIFKLLDGTTLTMGFPSPENGISVNNVYLDENKHLIVTLSDNTNIDAGLVPTSEGKPGKDGKDGATPFIGENGNWWINNVDSGHSATIDPTALNFHTLNDTIHVTPEDRERWNNGSGFSGTTNQHFITGENLKTGFYKIATISMLSIGHLNGVLEVVTEATDGMYTMPLETGAFIFGLDQNFLKLSGMKIMSSCGVQGIFLAMQDEMTCCLGVQYVAAEDMDQTCSISITCFGEESPWTTFDNTFIALDEEQPLEVVIATSENFWEQKIVSSDMMSDAISDTVSDAISNALPEIMSDTLSQFYVTAGQVSGEPGSYATAEGRDTNADGWYSHAEGRYTSATGTGAHAEGTNTTASGSFSHAEGFQTTAGGNYSHAEGESRNKISDRITDYSANTSSDAIITTWNESEDGKFSVAHGTYSHVEGSDCLALGYQSHAEGTETIASMYSSHAEGEQSAALGSVSHTEGYQTTAGGQYAHAEGSSENKAYDKIANYSSSTTVDDIITAWENNRFSLAHGKYSHIEGWNCLALQSGSHAEGQYTIASGAQSHAEGWYTTAKELSSHAEGGSTVASESYAHAEGTCSQASGPAAHAEGEQTSATRAGAHSEGHFTAAMGIYSHAEGSGDVEAVKRIERILESLESTEITTDDIIENWQNDIAKFLLAYGDCSHVEGYDCLALGNYSHAEGQYTIASAENTHAEGLYTSALGLHSHAEGELTTASGDHAHAEGNETTASGSISHAEGDETTASGSTSHAEGLGTIALDCQHAQGCYNDTSIATANAKGVTTGTAFVIGNGTWLHGRSNAFRVQGDGAVYAKSAYNATGADYAEFFEWADGNPDKEDRRGYFVTFDEEKTNMIRKAKPGEYILGIISANPCVIGNSDESWLGRYMMDEFGAFIYEEREVEETYFDEETNEKKTRTVKATFYKENPDYDPAKAYQPRAQRQEWDYVGMMGVLAVRDNGTCIPGGFCKVADNGIATVSEREHGAYRVIQRVSDNVVKVVFAITH